MSVLRLVVVVDGCHRGASNGSDGGSSDESSGSVAGGVIVWQNRNGKSKPMQKSGVMSVP